MTRGWKRTVAPVLPAVEDDEVFDHLRITDTANQSAGLRAISGATRSLEEYLQRGFLTQTWEYVQDAWTDEIVLPMAAPLQSVSSVKYYAADGTLTTLSSSVYLQDLYSEPGRVVRAPNQVWPTLQVNRPLAVLVTYVVGWTSAAVLPEDIRDGLLLLAGDRYEHREQSITGTITAKVSDVKRMLAGRRVWLPPVNCLQVAA